MRWLINYIRSCFCNHDWELLKELKYYNSEYDKRNDMASYIYLLFIDVKSVVWFKKLNVIKQRMI